MGSCGSPGRVMFEVSGVEDDIAHEALQLASHKLPIRTQIIARQEHVEQESKNAGK